MGEEEEEEAEADAVGKEVAGGLYSMAEPGREEVGRGVEDAVNPVVTPPAPIPYRLPYMGVVGDIIPAVCDGEVTADVDEVEMGSGNGNG